MEPTLDHDVYEQDRRVHARKVHLRIMQAVMAEVPSIPGITETEVAEEPKITQPKEAAIPVKVAPAVAVTPTSGIIMDGIKPAARPQKTPKINLAPATEVAAPIQDFIKAPAAPVVEQDIAPADVYEDTAETSPKRSFFSLKPALAAIAAIVILGSGSAATYASMIVPNQPSNVLGVALLRSMQQQHVTFDGQASYTNGSVVTSKYVFNGSVDNAARTAQVSGVASFPNIDVQAEARYIDNTAFLKIGDLSQVAAASQRVNPKLGSYMQQVGTQVSNQWISADNTFLNQLGVGCLTGLNNTFTADERAELKKIYSEGKLVSIHSVSTDATSGQPLQKYQITIDQAALAAATAGNSRLPALQKMQTCLAKITKSTNGSKMDVTLWVNTSTKHIVRFYTDSTNGTTNGAAIGSVDIILAYAKKEIVKPQGSVPVEQFMTNLQAKYGVQGKQALNLLATPTGAPAKPATR